MVRVYREMFKAILDALFKGTGSLPGALSATPTISVVGLDSSYTYTFTDNYAAIAAGEKTIFQVDYDGEDDEQAIFIDGTLWLDDGADTFGANDDAVASLLIYVNHGGWQLLVCQIDSFEGQPFSIVNGEAPDLLWSRLSHYVAQLVSNASGGTLYPRAIEEALGAILGGSARTSLPATAAPTVNLLTADASQRYADVYLSDIPDAWWAGGESVEAALASVTTNVDATGAYVDAADTTQTSVPGSNVATRGLLYDDSGDPATSLLIAQAALPQSLTLNGQNVTWQWLSSGNYVFRLEPTEGV